VGFDKSSSFPSVVLHRKYFLCSPKLQQHIGHFTSFEAWLHLVLQQGRVLFIHWVPSIKLLHITRDIPWKLRLSNPPKRLARFHTSLLLFISNKCSRNTVVTRIFLPALPPGSSNLLSSAYVLNIPEVNRPGCGVYHSPLPSPRLCMGIPIPVPLLCAFVACYIGNFVFFYFDKS